VACARGDGGVYLSSIDGLWSDGLYVASWHKKYLISARTRWPVTACYGYFSLSITAGLARSLIAVAVGCFGRPLQRWASPRAGPMPFGGVSVLYIRAPRGVKP